MDLARPCCSAWQRLIYNVRGAFLANLLDVREICALIVISIAGTFATGIAMAHALYLGFNLSYACPIIIVGILSVAIAYWRPGFRNLSAVLASPGRMLLLITAIGAVLRVILMFNPDATEDEWRFFFIVAKNNPFDIVNFVRNFNQIGGVYATETTPFPFIFMRLGYLLSPTLPGARLVPVAMNILLVPIAYYLARELSSDKVAQITAFLFAINPASLYFFDAVSTDIFVFFFSFVGLLFFVRGYKAGSFKQMILGGLMFGLAFWSKAALPDLWLGAAVLLVLTLMTKAGRLRKPFLVLMVVLIAVGTFLPWGTVNSQSFNASFIALPLSISHQLLGLPNLGLSGSGSVLTQLVTVSTATGGTSGHTSATTAASSILTTTAATSSTISTSTQSTSTTSNAGASAQSNGFLSKLLGVLALPSILPLFQAGAGTYTSFFDVIAQIPFWFGPVTLLVGFLFLLYGLSSKNKRGLHLAMFLWVLAIVFPLLSLSRDVRYFIDVATFPIIFLAAEAVGVTNKSFGRALEILVVSFAVVFVVLGAFAGLQLYSGIAEASNFVNHSYSHPSALVNYGGFSSLLSPGGKVNFLPYDATTLNSTLSTTKYDVVLIWYQARTTGFPSQLSSTLGSYYAHEAVFGLSNFSYVIVYYGYNGTD